MLKSSMYGNVHRQASHHPQRPTFITYKLKCKQKQSASVNQCRCSTFCMFILNPMVLRISRWCLKLSGDRWPQGHSITNKSNCSGKQHLSQYLLLPVSSNSCFFIICMRARNQWVITFTLYSIWLQTLGEHMGMHSNDCESLFWIHRA